MTRRALGPLSALAAALLAASVVLAAPGDHISPADFNLTAANDHPVGITWDGTYLRVLDSSDNKVYSYTSSGTYTPSADFNLYTTNLGNTSPLGITWDGNYLRVLDFTDDKVYSYTSSGTYTSSADFLVDAADFTQGLTWDGAYLRLVRGQLAPRKVYSYTSSGTYTSSADFDVAETSFPKGITWDGTYFRVVDSSDDKVYSYTSSGTYTSSADFDLTSANADPVGITWDGTYFRVVDSSDDKVYSYEGSTSSTPTDNYGLSEDNRDFAAAVSSTVVVYGDWKCIRSQTGEAVRINNARLTIHGFCAQPDSSAGMDVEIHLPTTAEYADLKRLADVTGSWWLIEEGIAAQFDLRIYDDGAIDAGDDEGALAFTKELGGLDDSDRLGFDTAAKSVSDDDCDEATDKAGFACDRSNLSSLSSGDEAVLLFSLTAENKVEFADTPTVPESASVSRNADYTEATVTWELYDAVTLYEIQRLTAVQVDVADASRIEYGDPVTYTVSGTQAGIDEYVDSTIEAHRTYQYRIRARGADDTSWSDWTEYVFSGAKPEVDLPAPGNLELDRDDDSVIASWAQPAGDFDNFTLQRQELLAVEGSTFFGNVVTLGGAAWLPGTSTMYTDESIIPNHTYEYRVAAVKDDQVGVYTDWFRVGPPNTSLGGAPDNFKFLAGGQRLLDERREFWMGWDDVPGADDYEVQVLVYDVASGGQSMEEYIVTDATYFTTSYGRVGLRVRGRKLDVDACSSALDDRCLTDWTGWYEVRFTPTVTIDSPPVATPDASVMDLRDDTEEMLEAVMSPAGATVDGSLVIEFLVLVAAVAAAGLSVALSWRRGMASLGVGMGAAILILILFAGYRLFGTPLAWPVAAQALVAVAGLFALVRQTGVFR